MADPSEPPSVPSVLAGSAVALWARRELAARWPSLVVLGLLLGLVGGVAIAATAGARRTGTAYGRWQEATDAPDAIVFGTQLGLFDLDYGPVTELAEVADAGTFALAPIVVEEHPELGTLAPDDRLNRTLARPLLNKGRLPDPDRDDEIVVNRAAASQLGLGLGDRVTILSSEGDLEAAFSGGPIDGPPRVVATVVGVGDSAMDLTFGGIDEPGFTSGGGFFARHPEVPRAQNLVVRLEPGSDIEEFRVHAAAALGLPDIPVRDLGEDDKRVTNATDLERTSLLLFVGAVALAGLVLVGQALVRTVYGMAEAASALRAIGFTRREVVTGLVVVTAVPAFATAAVSAVGLAFLLSDRFPVGLAGRFEVHQGRYADWGVLLPGAALLVLAALVSTAAAAGWATRTGRRSLVGARPGLVQRLLA
ncbi:MAG: hypothetical protein M3R01_05125, partial [Actinomycetota bacterium]|nr:hypothetical protein [Actinomycetota bacterium]